MLGFSYDRASPNISAMRTLAAVYPFSEQLPCVSHTLCHCGEHFFTPFLSKFLVQWRGLFAHSKAGTNRWQRLALSSFPLFSDTRWWSEYEEMVYMLVHREHRETFLFNSFHGEFCDSAYIKHMYSATFDNSDNGRAWQKSELELVAVAEGGRPFVQATYFLEDEGLVILFVYDWLKHIELFIQNS